MRKRNLILSLLSFAKNNAISECYKEQSQQKPQSPLPEASVARRSLCDGLCYISSIQGLLFEGKPCCRKDKNSNDRGECDMKRFRNPVSRTLPRALALASTLTATLLNGCGAQDEGFQNPERVAGNGLDRESTLSGVSAINPKITPISAAELSNYSFALSTPTGANVFRYAVGWEKIQLIGANKKYFPQKAMCATNVSEVFEEVFGAKYNDAGVGNMLSKLRKSGAKNEIRFKGDSSSSIATKLNNLLSNLPATSSFKGKGYLPIGTVVAGCTVGRNCFGGGPDEHVGFIGNAKIFKTTSAGLTDVVYYVWNNNWLRKLDSTQRKRDLGYGLGILDKYSLPANFATLGYERRWMGVPWLKVTYNKAGAASQVVRLVPELDDLDPGNAGFDVFLVVPKEIENELAASKGKVGF